LDHRTWAPRVNTVRRLVDMVNGEGRSPRVIGADDGILPEKAYLHGGAHPTTTQPTRTTMHSHLFPTDSADAARERFSIMERVRAAVYMAHHGQPLDDDLATPPPVLLFGATSIKGGPTGRLFGVPILGYATENGDRLLEGAYEHVKAEREQEKPLLGEDDPENEDLRLMGVGYAHGVDDFGVEIKTPEGELLSSGAHVIIAWSDMQLTNFIVRQDGMVDWTLSSTELPLDYDQIAPATDYARLEAEGLDHGVDPEESLDLWLHRIVLAMTVEPDGVTLLV